MSETIEEGFVLWLVEQGCEILPTLTHDEALRYKVERRIVVVHANKAGRLRAPAVFDDHLRAYRAGSGIRSYPVRSPASTARSYVVARLLSRDGDPCFYCGLPLGPEPTIEHLLARSAGGGNQLENLCLSHSSCNRGAGNRPIVDKVAFREAMRADPNRDPVEVAVEMFGEVSIDPEEAYRIATQKLMEDA